MANNQLGSPLTPGLFVPIAETIEEIDLSHNNLTRLEANSLGELKVLDTLRLRANQLNTIDDKALSDLASLATLDLGANRLSGKDVSFLCSLDESLEELRLDRNRIAADYDHNDFLCLGKLAEIDLCWNPAFVTPNAKFNVGLNRNVGIQQGLRMLNGGKRPAGGAQNAPRQGLSGGKLLNEQQPFQQQWLQQQQALDKQMLVDPLCNNLEALRQVWSDPDNNQVQ